MSSISLLRPLLPVLLFLGCGPQVAPVSLSPLDYAEIVGEDGWRLRVNGDGSGTLTHRQHPLHHLDYPPATFRSNRAKGLKARCRKGQFTGCLGITFYRARADQTTTCPCVAEQWPIDYMVLALENMQAAVDDASSHKACRMLRRTWLAAR